MPATNNNIRRITWDAASPARWHIRWREKGSTNWNIYPVELIVPEAIFGVLVVGEDLPTNVDYITILELGRTYEVQVQHICSDTSSSSWSATSEFDTYLACPNFGAPGSILITDVSDVLHPYRVRIEYTYDAKGGVPYPTLKLQYKPSTASWGTPDVTEIDYPRDGTKALIDLLGPGQWNFRILSVCKSGASTVDSGDFTTTIGGTYPPPESPLIRPTNIGARVNFSPPSNQPTPVLAYEYRADGGTWVDIGLATQFDYTGLVPGAAPADKLIEVRAKYALAYSVDIDINYKNAPSTDVFQIGNTPIQSPWTVPVVTLATLDNQVSKASYNITFKATGLIAGQQYGFNAGAGNVLNGRVQHANGSTYYPTGNYALPIMGYAKYDPVSGLTVAVDTTGYIQITGWATADVNGEVIVHIIGAWETL